MITMETPPNAKPTPPPKPSPLRTKKLTSAERFFKDNPVIPRQKPPLAPKPVIPAKPCLGAQARLQKKHLGAQVGVSSERWEQVTNHSPCHNSRVTTVETVRVERIVSTGDVVTRDSSIVTSIGTASCEAEKIIQDTWASLQEKTARPPDNNTNNIFLRKFIQSSSPLFSSELTNELNTVLPVRVRGSENFTRRNSDVTNDGEDPTRENKDAHRPSLQFSPPTPETNAEDWVLVDEGNGTETKSLPSKNLSDSSPCSNSSFLYSSANPNLNSSSESSKPSCEQSDTSDCDVTLRNKKPGQHPRGASWSEDNEAGRSRTNSIGNESFDGSNNTIRRRISSIFGSFGRGGKTKEKRESSLFYYNPGDDSSQMESSDSGRNSMTSLNESSNSTNNNNNNVESPSNSKRNLNVSECCDGDSNRSSISDESFDAEQSTKSNNKNKENSKENVDPVERRKRKCFLIVNELMTSERVFIDVLKLLCHDFKRAVDEASISQKSPVIPQGDFNKIINNLPQLLSLNEDLLRDIESRIETWDKLPKVADVIVKKGPFLKLYSSYIQNFEAQTEILDDCCDKYRKFAQVVRDFERSDRCKKLALKHYMLKPIQRIPQYRLLLDDYLEHQDPDSPDYADTQAALKIVCDVANHANRSIKEGDHLSKLLSIQSQLGDYEIIKPGRHFVKEGELYKLSRKDMQQRFFILLSDCLLYTSYYGSMTGLKVKYKLPLAGMKVSRSQSTDCRTEFSIITSTRSFILRAKNEEECVAWVEALQTSIRDYISRQMTFNKLADPMSLSNETLKIGREVFSHTVSTAMKTAVEASQLPPEAKQTAEFLLEVNNIFDAMNSRTKFNVNPRKSAISDGKDPHLAMPIKTIKDGIKWVKTWKMEHSSKRPPSFIGMQHTLKATVLLWEDLKKEGVTYLLTTRINQDALENEFSIARQGGGYNNNPTARSFRQKLRHRIQCALLQPSTAWYKEFLLLLDEHKLWLVLLREKLQAPVWIQDKRVTMCQLCTAEFTMTFRRHHCRACGKVVCSDCSDYKAPMQYMHFNSDRVCIECYNYLLKEMDDPTANIMEAVRKELATKCNGTLTEEEVVAKMKEIRSLFKKIGRSTGEKIKTKYVPPRLKEVAANDSGSQMSGWLLRKSRTRWKRLWFVLKEQVLYAYKASEDVVAVESIPVLGYNLETIPEGECDDAGLESKVLFRLVHPGQPPLVFATDSHSADRWMSAFREATTLK